jgi:transcriptional regulator with XRE-family HTH domain
MNVVIDGLLYVPAPWGGKAPLPLGAYLRELRRAHGWSLATAAGRGGISRAYLHGLERGDRADPSLRVAIRLAEAYGIPLAYLAAALDFRGDGAA